MLHSGERNYGRRKDILTMTENQKDLTQNRSLYHRVFDTLDTTPTQSLKGAIQCLLFFLYTYVITFQNSVVLPSVERLGAFFICQNWRPARAVHSREEFRGYSDFSCRIGHWINIYTVVVDLWESMSKNAHFTFKAI